MIKEELYRRIQAPRLLSRVMTAKEAAEKIEDGMTIGLSGFASVGYPQAIPREIAARGVKRLTVLSGASTGPEADGVLARAGCIVRRVPFQSDKILRGRINDGDVKYCDLHLSQMSRYLHEEIFGPIDYAVVACCAVTENGEIIPLAAVGAADALIRCAERVILEVNLNCPVSIRGIHDIYESRFSSSIPIFHPADRVGKDSVPCPYEKIAGIVVTDEPLHAPVFTEPDEVSRQIAGNLIAFLEKELSVGGIGSRKNPIQSGVGNIANAVMDGFRTSGLRDLTMYTEVLQDAAYDLLREGIISSVSTTSMPLSTERMQDFFDNIDERKKHIVIRSSEISNHPEIIQRLGVIAMNTAVEADLYGNVNSTHIMGTSIINGIGGAGDFSRHASLSIFMTPAMADGGKISRIVPMCTHVDHTEHDVHVLVTEYGLADLRGKSPQERAELIIENCCAPMYRKSLREYFEHSKHISRGQHTPHDLAQAFSWHLRYRHTGTMREEQ